MTQEKLTLKQILGCIDMNYKGAWDEFTEEERKSVSFWLLNRYVSSVSGNRQKQEAAIEKTNNYYNRHFLTLHKNHKPLLWKLLCISGATHNIEFHPWIGLKQKKNPNNKTIKLLMNIYPNMKMDEVETLARISTKAEIKQLAEEHGYEKKDIDI